MPLPDERLNELRKSYMKKSQPAIHQSATLLAAFSGTSLMTVYSILTGRIQHEKFSEPKLLGQMIHRLLPGISCKQSVAGGWLAHYAMGVLFAETYIPFWTGGDMKVNVRTGLVLGGLSGLAAILIWKFSFNIHPLPPSVNFVRFAGQLFVAHVVFGIFAAVGYSLITPPEMQQTFLSPP